MEKKYFDNITKLQTRVENVEKYQNLHTKQQQQEELLRKLEKAIQAVSDENNKLQKQQNDLKKKHVVDITKIEKKHDKDIKEMKGE